jgi:hypothetical protein
MKVIRVLIYEGDEEWMQRQLGGSVNDGKKDLGHGRSIKAITLGTMPDIVDVMLPISEGLPGEERKEECPST